MATPSATQASLGDAHDIQDKSQAQQDSEQGHAGQASTSLRSTDHGNISTTEPGHTSESPSELPVISTPAAAPLRRQVSEAIGPSTDDNNLPVHTSDAAGAVVQFTLLLASTGTRHPFQLNERYLSKRNVTATDDTGKFDPASISVYTLKELILKDWRDDWDQKPTSPSAIRLIFFGQLLSDNVSLRDSKISTEASTNVLHITVKPQDIVDDEDAGKGGKGSVRRARSTNGSSSGCRCVIM